MKNDVAAAVCTATDKHEIKKAATNYLQRGWSVLLLPPRSKEPYKDTPWTACMVTDDNLHTLTERDNLGIIFSKAGGLKDYDLDYQVAAALANKVSMKGAAFGRKSVIGHRLFDAPGCEAKKFELPIGDYPRPLPMHEGKPSRLVAEIRGNDNTYTMFPPSVHPCGERLEWIGEEREPTKTTAAELRALAGRHAFAAAVLYFYPDDPSARFDTRLSLTGALTRAGMPAEQVTLYVRQVAKLAGDPRWQENFAERTEKRLEEDKPTTGMTKLIETLGLPPACKATFREWLQIADADENQPLIVELATRLWGEPTERSESQYRFGQKIIELRSGLWFDFESNVGGRVFDLMEMAAARDEASEEEVKLIWHGDVDPRESRHYLVQYVIPEIGCGLISGQWGMFKTFVAFDLAHCVMAGLPFLGFEVVRRGGVLFVALEGTDEVAIRLQGVIEHKGNLQARAPFVWIETCPALSAKNAVAKLSELAEAAAVQMREKFDLPLALIVIDTMIAAAGYTKEGQDNDTATGQMVMSTMRKVARKLGCFVFGVDHFGKDVSTGTRGMARGTKAPTRARWEKPSGCF